MSSKKPINILDRYKRFNIINNIIDEKIKKDKNKCLYPVKFGVYTLNDVILLFKKIGSNSSYGSIFLSEIKDKNNHKYKFATKVQLLTDDTYAELNYLKLVTKTSIDNKNIHFPLMYNNLECSYFNKNDELMPLNLRDNDKDKNFDGVNSYYSTFVELANGDLGSFILKNYKKITLKQLKNILGQCFIAILSCHRLKFNHNDSHIYNFLYHIIKTDNNSCFKYVYNDLVFYIENVGLNWVIWDFGFSEKIGFFNNNYLRDYIDLIAFLINKILHDYNIILFNEWLEHLFYDIQKFNNDYDLIKHLLHTLFSDKPIGNIIITINL
jgi:hypothetical protein